MDPEWLQSLAAKDYLFPDRWSVATWLQHAAYLVVIAVTFRARARLGLARRGEYALAAGLLVMLVALAAALPLVSARIALAWPRPRRPSTLSRAPRRSPPERRPAMSASRPREPPRANALTPENPLPTP